MAQAPSDRPRPLEAGHFFGRNVRSQDRSGFVLSETHYRPRQLAPPHSHELPYFCLLVDGSYWETYGRRTVRYRPGSIAFHPAHEAHHGGMGPAQGRVFHVEVGHSWVEHAESHGPLPHDTIDRQGGELSWLGLRLFREFWKRDDLSPLVVEGLVLEMLGRVARVGVDRPGYDRPAWLGAAVERVHDEFDRRLTVRGMARDLGVSPVRLSRAFRRTMGESIGDCVRRLRVERVCERLQTSDASLAMLASQTGFSDQSHLTRVFKRATGFTPGQYRRLFTG